MGAAKDRAVYQFKVSLAHISPPIWRRIQVWEDSTLHQLHRVLQAVMGWENYHLYEFVTGAKKYRDPHPENERKIRDARRTRLPMILPRVGATIEYVYDFGDGWRHELLLEGILVPDLEAVYPRCIVGERNCPPEDSGGPLGYAEYLQAMADPSHERHDEMMEWRGPFDPEAFSMEKVNRELEKEFRPARKRTSPRRVSGKPEPPPEAFDEAAELLQGLLAGAGAQQEKRIRIKQNETIPLELNARERELILSHTFADEELTKRLKTEPKVGERPVFHYSPDDLEELVGFVAAEANHAKDKKLQKELDQLLDRIEATLDRNPDDVIVDRGKRVSGERGFALEGGTHIGKRITWVDKETKRGFRGYPAATMAFYGPTADMATKIVVAIVREEGCEPDPLERWFSEDIDVRADLEIGERVLAFLKEHAVKSVVATDRIIGCPHEEGIDYPEGKSCPQCPYWAGRDRFTHERIQ